MMKVYLASGWWLPGHLEALQRLEEELTQKKHPFFSPRLVEPQLTKDSTPQERQDVFERNLQELRSARLVFARIDDYDPGTIWEMAYAYAHHRFVVAWSLVPGRSLNLMLSESCRGFLNGWKQIGQFFLPESKLNREVAQQWQQSVV